MRIVARFLRGLYFTKCLTQSRRHLLTGHYHSPVRSVTGSSGDRSSFILPSIVREYLRVMADRQNCIDNLVKRITIFFESKPWHENNRDFPQTSIRQIFIISPNGWQFRGNHQRRDGLENTSRKSDKSDHRLYGDILWFSP
jgi:hypothetical protein